MTATADVSDVAAAEITEPGVYDLDEAAYHADPVPGGSLSCSGAKKLLPPSCPARYQHDRLFPPLPKEHFEHGTAAHKLILGAGPYLQLVDRERWDTNDAKQEVATIRETGGIPLKRRDMDQVQEMAAALHRHPQAAALLNPERGDPEQNLFWTDPETGIWRRARLDFLRRSGGGRVLVTDYKTCVAADRDSIRKTVASYSYFMQDPWYRDAVTALGLDDDPGFVFVFQEKTPPYLVNVVQLDGDAITAGAERNRAACEKWRDCTETGIWPGYCDYNRDPDVITLPPWAARPIEDLYA